MSACDVYLYGMTLMTTSHRLGSDFPEPDNYCEIIETHRFPGGESGTCAVVLDGLGAAVQLDGNFLGRSTNGEVAAYFASSSVSLELMTYDPGFDGLEDLVFVDQNSRTAFGRFEGFYEDESTRRWNNPSEAAIARADVVGLDPFFFEESLEVAHLCHEHSVSYVVVDCPADSELHSLSEVTVLSSEYLRSQYPGQSVEVVFDAYVRGTSGLVIFTFGPDGVWYGRAELRPQRFPSYEVEVQSTLGAGDAFKAGAIYALSRGMDDRTLVRFASATAAAACMSYPIAENPPTLERVRDVAGEPFDGGTDADSNPVLVRPDVDDANGAQRAAFRSAAAADTRAICGLWAAAGVGAGFEIDSHEITERLKNDDGFFVVGERGDRMVAVAMGCYDDHRGWMKRVAVDPSEEGGGLGRALVTEVERRFLESGITKLRLSVWDENVGALSFWRELDYVELPDIHYFTKDL
jgi:sugar/nucleoside kinase (ribokinase family)/ribosomal protein S18 acetylase RimI-like enzyme